MKNQNVIYETVLARILQESNSSWWNYINSYLSKNKEFIRANGQSLAKVNKIWGSGTKSCLAILYTSSLIPQYRSSLNKICILEIKKSSKMIIEDLKKIKNKLSLFDQDQSVESQISKLFDDINKKITNSVNSYKKYNDWKSLLTSIVSYCALSTVKSVLHNLTDLISKSFSKNDPKLIAASLSLDIKEKPENEIKSAIVSDISNKMNEIFNSFLSEQYENLSGKKIVNTCKTPLEWHQKVSQSYSGEEFINSFVFSLVKKSGYKEQDIV